MRKTLNSYIEYYVPIFEVLCSQIGTLDSFEYCPYDIADSLEKDFCKNLNKILKLKNYKNIIKGIFDRLKPWYQREFIFEILGSDINIFCDWYVELLDICMKSEDCMIAGQSKGLNDLYKVKFDEIRETMKI